MFVPSFFSVLHCFADTFLFYVTFIFSLLGVYNLVKPFWVILQDCGHLLLLQALTSRFSAD